MTTGWALNLLDEHTVVWGPPIRDGAGGYSSWPTPSQIQGRWQYGVGSSGPRVEYRFDGSIRIARTCVWTESSIELGSYLWKGSLTTISGSDTPETLQDARQVVAIKNVRSLVTDDYLYKAYLDEVVR
jgi:hypothetical protein